MKVSNSDFLSKMLAFIVVCHGLIMMQHLLDIPSTGVDSDDANSVMDLIRKDFVNGDCAAAADDDSGIKLVDAEEFS